MNALDWITNVGVAFPMPGATRFKRLRAARYPSPYNPSDTVEDWDHPEELEFQGALTQSSSTRTQSSSTRTVDGLREQTGTSGYITSNDPTLDIKGGDRIMATPDDGRRWEVSADPSRDVNAFTAFRPTIEIPITEWRG